MIRAQSLLAAALLAGFAVAAASSDSQPNSPRVLEPIPEPRFEVMEPTVRDQLTAARAELDAVLSDTAAPSSDREGAALAGDFGALGQLYHAYDLFTPAAACYRNAERLDSTDFRWPYYLGVLHQLDGRDAEALASFTKASELRPNHLPILLRLAQLHLGAGDDGRAEALFQQVLASNPASAAALVGLGRIASARGDSEAAIQNYARALELQSEADRLHYLLGIEHRRLGDLDKAAEHLAQSGPSGVGFFEPLLLEIQRLAVGSGAALGRGGDAQMLGMYDVALNEYRSAVANAPQNPDAHFALGSLLLAMGSAEEALGPLGKAVKLDPGQPQSRFLFGHTLFQLGRLAEAEPELRSALELDPGLHEARSSLAALVASKGDLAEAVALYRGVLEEEPADFEARLGLGKALVMTSRVEEGLAEFDAVLAAAREPEALAQAHYNRAVVDAGKRAADDVVRRLDTALELAPGLADARILKARLLASSGETARAIAEIDRVVSEDPSNSTARLTGAGILAAAGRVREARQLLEEGLASDAGNGALSLMLARLLACAEPASARDGEAALGLAESLFEARRSLEHAEVLAMALAESGRFEEATGLQESLVAEARRRGLDAWSEHLERNLERYRMGRRCELGAGASGR